MAVSRLVVPAQAPLHKREHMARKMRNPYRVQDQKALLVRHKPQTRTALRVAPADPTVPRCATPRRSPAQRTAHDPTSAVPHKRDRCSPPPASTARDSGTAPEPHAEAADPSPPQPTPIPAAAPKAAPKTAPIPTSQPSAPLHPTRYSDDSLDPGNAAQEAGSDPPPKASEAANAPQCPSAERCCCASASARKAQPKAANDPNPGAPTTAPGSPTTPRARSADPEQSDP